TSFSRDWSSDVCSSDLLAEAHTMMALVAAEQGRYELAGTHHAEAARLAPSGMTYNNYGAWLCANGRAAESLEWFDQAVLDPRYRSEERRVGKGWGGRGW